MILSAPVNYTLELYPWCNNYCQGCGNISYNLQEPLSFANWNRIIAEISTYATHLRISGGEPTLHPDFNAILETLSFLDTPFVLFTNGRWRNPDNLINELIKIPNFRGMLISIHSHVPEIHDSFTGIAGSFSETIRNVRKAIDRGLPIAANSILLSPNIDYVEELISLCETIGVCQTTFSRYVAVRNYDLNPTPENLKLAIEKIEKKREEGSTIEYSVCIPQCFKLNSSVGCLSGIAYCVIDPWGNVRPCTHVSINCGNILEQPIEKIWRSPTMNNWRSLIPTQCSYCSEISKCRGGCRAIAYLDNLPYDPLKTQPFLENPAYTEETVVLHEDMVPTNDFIVREESFGYALIRENFVVPVSFDAKFFFEAINGEMTLREINERYGIRMITFIGNLYREGILRMELPKLRQGDNSNFE